MFLQPPLCARRLFSPKVIKLKIESTLTPKGFSLENFDVLTFELHDTKKSATIQIIVIVLFIIAFLILKIAKRVNLVLQMQSPNYCDYRFHSNLI